MTKIQSTKETKKGENKREKNPMMIYQTVHRYPQYTKGFWVCLRHSSSTLASTWLTRNVYLLILFFLYIFTVVGIQSIGALPPPSALECGSENRFTD